MTKLFVFPLILLLLASCKAQIKEFENTRASSTGSNSTITYTCSYHGAYDTQSACQSATLAQCTSQWKTFPSGGASTCFEPVSGWEVCSNVTTSWIYGHYGSWCDSGSDGYPGGPTPYPIATRYRSVIGCSSNICVCPSTQTVSESCYVGFDAGCPTSITSLNACPSFVSLRNQMVSLWHLNELVGTTGAGSVLDELSYAVSGTPTSMTFGGSGKVSTSAYFNGVTSYIDFSSPTSLKLQNNFSIAFWINPSSITSSPMIYSWSGAGGYQIGLSLGNITFGRNGSGIDLISATTLSTSTWTHVGLTVDVAGVIRLYLNGVETDTGSTTLTTPSGNLTLSLFSAPFEGDLDEVAVWSTALSAGQMKRVYLSGSSGNQL